MKKSFLLILGIAFVGMSKAQVGINTKSPQGVFHIDSQSNTVGTTNISDDVIVTSLGKVGIGTVTPQTKLDVIGGALRIADGSEGAGKVFTATNTQGLGSWQTPDLRSRIGIWQIANKGLNPYETASEIILKDANVSAPSYIKNNEIALVGIDNYRLRIPAGKYMVFVEQDVSNGEYGAYSIKNAADNSIVYRQIYAEWLAGAAFVLNAATDLTVYISWMPEVRSTVYYDQIGSVQQLNFSKLTFLSLQ